MSDTPAQDAARAETRPPRAGVFLNIPVLNEAENIQELLSRIDAELGDRPYTVCIVDDGSTDGTREIVSGLIDAGNSHIHLMTRTKTARGSQRGGALYAAMSWGLAHTDHAVFVEMDGDLSHRPEELSGGLSLVASGGADLVIASKYQPGSQVTNRPFGRKLVSKVCSVAVRIVLSRRVVDYSNGYRFYNRRAAELITQHRIRYTSPIYLTEVLALWMRAGLRIAEIPTVYVGRNEGLSKLRFSDLFKAVFAIFEVAGRFRFFGFRRKPELLKAHRCAAESGRVP